MKAQISLRQHKIIQQLRNNRSYMTGSEIADALNVSTKTLRADINDINRQLNKEGISIESAKSKGYILRARDPEALKRLTKDQKVFLGRSDRLYYLATRLCTSTDPLDLYDLEDEMAVSSSTLSSDITDFKTRFVHGVPNIDLSIIKNALVLEKDEYKRRFILTKLLIENWDYNSTGNVYYKSDFIDSGVFNIINSCVAAVLYCHGFYMEDYNLIMLNLYLSIAYHRINDGFVIKEVPAYVKDVSEEVTAAGREVFAELEQKLEFRFPEAEMTSAFKYINEFNLHTDGSHPERAYPKSYYSVAKKYLARINDTFGIDLSDDEVFFEDILFFISRMHDPMKDLSVRGTPDSIKHNMFVEHDIAVLFHRIGKDEFPVTEEDLLYLSYAVSGAFLRRMALYPDQRIKAVLMCHLNGYAMKSLKLSIENQFSGYLDIKEALPLNQKDFYDFSGTEMILTTVDKNISGVESEGVLHISPYLKKDDSHAISDRIRELRLKRLLPKEPVSLVSLLKDAFVHEDLHFSSRFDLIEFMCSDFVEKGIFTQEHMFSILKRESVSTFASDPSVLLLYSTIPGKKTKLSVLTLDHRITWNSHRIRTVFLVSLAKKDMNELFYLQDVLFHKCFDPEILKDLKTIEELIEYYKAY